MQYGWIKFYREFINEPVWLKATSKQKVIMITLMCMANHKENQWEFGDRTITLKPGEMVTSVQSIIDRCSCDDITRQIVRTALAFLRKHKFLTYKTTNAYTLIKLEKWQDFQVVNSVYNQADNQQITNPQPTNNQRLTTNNKYNNYNNYNKYNKYTQNSVKPGFCNYTQEEYSDEMFKKIENKKIAQYQNTEFDKETKAYEIFNNIVKKENKKYNK